MIQDFKLTGLSKPRSMTCEPLNNENIFWPPVGLTQKSFDAFWEYYKGRTSGEKFIAEIECDGIRSDGTPINPVVVGTREGN